MVIGIITLIRKDTGCFVLTLWMGEKRIVLMKYSSTAQWGRYISSKKSLVLWTRDLPCILACFIHLYSLWLVEGNHLCNEPWFMGCLARANSFKASTFWELREAISQCLPIHSIHDAIFAWQNRDSHNCWLIERLETSSAWHVPCRVNMSISIIYIYILYINIHINYMLYIYSCILHIYITYIICVYIYICCILNYMYIYVVYTIYIYILYYI